MRSLLLAVLVLPLVACGNRDAEMHACEKAADDWLAQKTKENEANTRELIEAVAMLKDETVAGMGTTKQGLARTYFAEAKENLTKLEAQHTIRLKNCATR